MAEPITFFDSNILIAALVARHTYHVVASDLLNSIPAGRGTCAAHSLAETYNTLTNRPRGYGVPPRDAAQLIRHVMKKYATVSLTPDEILDAIESTAEQELAGPIIYDALLMACARKIGADAIYTYNVRHFRLVAPDLASRIMEP